MKRVWSRRSPRLVSSILFFCFFIVGCEPKQVEIQDGYIDRILTYKETEALSELQNKSLDAVRSRISSHDVERLVKFYSAKSYYFSNTDHLDSLHRYADSALAIFQNKQRINDHRMAYFDALLLKGDASYLSKKYALAVLKYLEARSFQQQHLDKCIRKGLVMRIGNVYYVQGKYQPAITYFKESYELALRCKPTSSPLKQFYDTQAVLNTIGFCYERLAMLDSAQYYYQKDIDFIEQSRKHGKIANYATTDASAIAFDNLGSVYLKKGDLKNSEKLLLKSISTDYSGGNDAKIPPLIKLANVYIAKGKLNLADSCLTEAQLILTESPDLEFQSRWHISKANLEQQRGNYKAAFAHQQKHFTLHDTVHNDLIKISAINVEQEFAALQQKYELQDLEKDVANKNVYLIFAAILLLFGTIIVLLLQRNVKQSRKNNTVASLRNAELQESLLKLEDVNRNYARVMKVMAHDLRNPLGGISGLSSLLISEQTEESNKIALSTIQSSADGALKMIDEILNAVLTQEDEKNLPKTKINLNALLQQCVMLLNFKAEEKNQKLIVVSTTEHWMVANEEKLWRVFNNLIVNAIKFSTPNTNITIKLDRDENYTTVAIVDHGIGIPEEMQDQIYNMFTEAKREGTSGEKPYGLGLSISKQIVEMHGGKIWHEKNPEGGTIFHVQLPTNELEA